MPHRIAWAMFPPGPFALVTGAATSPFLRRSIAVAFVLLAGMGVCGSASAHGVHHRSSQTEAVVVQFFYHHDDRPNFEPYEVFPPNSETPFQTGRLNAAGEVSFRPDREGEWRVRVTTANGHGSLVRIDVEASGEAIWHGGGSRTASVIAALGYLAGIFGILSLWRLRLARRG